MMSGIFWMIVVVLMTISPMIIESVCKKKCSPDRPIPPPDEDEDDLIDHRDFVPIEKEKIFILHKIFCVKTTVDKLIFQ